MGLLGGPTCRLFPAASGRSIEIGTRDLWGGW